MALSTTQVNAAFVALLGRAAEGNANAWAVNSADTKTLANTILSVDGKYKDSLEQAKTNEDFVEALYKQVLGRNSDADGKAVWLKALASGTSREELMTKFVAAAKAEDPNLTAFYTSNQQFLENVYSALLNRGVDNSGLETWMNLLQNGTSRAEVVAKIIDAINANKDSDDYAIYNAKMSVADAVTKVFAGPKAGLNEEQNKALNEKLVGIMSSVTSAEVTEESIKAEIANVVGSYGKEAAPLTFKAVTENMEKYDLGNAESATAQTFRGNINLQDSKKSTISDKATLKTSNFSDTLVVDVIPSTTGAEFDYNDNAKQVKKFAEQAGITNLTINNGTAGIKNLDNTGISENLKITGAANVSGSITANLQYLEINTGGKADATAKIDVKANLKEYVGKGSGKDEITISGNGTVKTVDLGAGNDTLTVSGGSIANATIKLGAGDDTFKFNSGTVSGATINGGTGADTIVLSGDASAIKSLTSFEKISLSTDGTLKIAAFKGNIDSLKGANLAFGASEADKKLTLNASDATTIDLSKVVKDAGASSGADIELTNVGSGTTSGVTITLNKDDNIAEKIILVADAKNNNAVTITGIASGDKLDAKAAGVASTITVASNSIAELKSNATTVADGKAYFVTATSAIDTVDKAVAALSSIGAKFTANSKKALIGFNHDGKSYLFAANGDDQTASIVASELTLVGIVDNTLGGGDKVTAGVIEFA